MGKLLAGLLNVGKRMIPRDSKVISVVVTRQFIYQYKVHKAASST